MALNKNHQAHVDLTNAFDSADQSASKGITNGHASYGMAKSSGMPRSTAQMASVKKAAAKSALSRGERAGTRSPTAAVTPGPAANAFGPLKAPPGISTGGLSLVKKPKGGGLLG